MSNQNKTVAIVGRPNVGKSTLFNRLVGKRQAIETPVPGTTRDRIIGEVTWLGKSFDLVDLAGIEKVGKSELEQNIQASVDYGIEQSDLVLFVVDWTQKDNPVDRTIARKILKTGKDVILIINKADNIDRIKDIEEFKRLGSFKDFIGVSSISGKNTGDMLDLIFKKLEIAPGPLEEKEQVDINLAIIGRPNVGKSTLLNQIIGKERAIVSEEAGTTRDIIDAIFVYKGKKIEIVDTAGIRRRGKVDFGSIEDFSVLRSYKALRESDVAILVIDSIEGLVARDANILGQAKEWGKALVLAVNKIDLAEVDRVQFMSEILGYLQEKLNFTPWLPVVFISAKDKENINALLNQVLAAWESRQTVIDQQDLDEILEHAKNANFQLQNMTALRQKRNNPPTFEVKFKGRNIPHYTQLRYLENKIRDNFPMSGTPIYLDAISRAPRNRNKNKKR